jgi:hypothetical protein
MEFPGKPSPLLLRAIDNADKATLQAVLKSMCESSNDITAAASLRLLKTKVQEVVDLEDDENDRTPARKKQKRETVVATQVSRYETCATCHKRFDTTDNAEDACQLHDGKDKKARDAID